MKKTTKRKIVFPNDVRTILEDMYETGKLFKYFRAGEYGCEDILNVRIFHPYKGAMKKLSAEEYRTVALPWVKAWADKEYGYNSFGIRIIKESLGMYSYYSKVYIPNGFDLMKKIFTFLGKEDEYQKFIRYEEAIEPEPWHNLIRKLFINDKEFREWVYTLPDCVPKAVLPSEIKEDDAKIAALVLDNIMEWCKKEPDREEFARNIRLPYVGTKFLERNLRQIRKIDDVMSDIPVKTIKAMLERHKIILTTPSVPDVILPGKGCIRQYRHLSAEELTRMFAANPPRVILFSENTRPMLKSFDYRDIVVIGGTGRALVSFVENCPWLVRVEKVYHWGDCDADGYSILNGMRKYLPNLHSFLMGKQVIEEVPKELFTNDSRKRKFSLSNLTEDEKELCVLLDKMADDSQKGIRLEQEFIPDDIVQWNLDFL